MSSPEEVLAILTLEQKAGLLFHSMAMLVGDVDPEAPGLGNGPSLRELIVDRGIRYFCVAGLPDPAAAPGILGRLQELAVTNGSKLPIVFSSDPRHGFLDVGGAAQAARGLSQWPEPIGFGALADADAVFDYARTVRDDYRAMGLRMALHPQVDLTTEPRWARQAQSFGTAPALTANLARAYIRGLQGDALDADGVAATTKHFPGGGAQLDGEDPHFPYGREQVYPGGRFSDHLAPFVAAIEAGTAVMMPYYGMPVGLTVQGRKVDEVGFAFSRQIVHELLRVELGYQGMVLSDFGLVTDQEIFGKPFPARAWGVEHLSRRERVVRLLESGVDQLGGEADVDLVLEAVELGELDPAIVDRAAGRVLALHEKLGLLAEPQVAMPSDAVESLPCDAPTRREAGLRVQSRAVTVLADGGANSRLLPLDTPRRVYLEGVDAAALPEGWQVADVDSAEIAVARVGAPSEHRDDFFLESGMQQGSLEFAPGDVERLLALAERLPLILAVTLSRPAILTPLVDAAAVIVGEYGASDEALFAALTGKVPPEGRLPFELPRSMRAVAAASPDAGADTRAPLFPLGWSVEHSNR